MLAERRITIELRDAARVRLADEGWDPVYGARPLKRAMQRELKDPLAMAMLEGRIADGNHVIVDVSADGSGLSFNALDLEPALV